MSLSTTITGFKMLIGKDNSNKKPKIPGRLYTNYDGQGPRIFPFCPCCEKRFEEYGFSNNQPNECPNCKQKLDWTYNLWDFV